VVTGRLELVWTYSHRIHQQATIERLAWRYTEILGELIDHCCAPPPGGRTPGDFPLAGLDRTAIDMIQQRLEVRFGG
jgi:non-ribosomal peptide synthase protein (TIGR01720 family)